MGSTPAELQHLSELEQHATVDAGELIAELMEAAANFRAVLTERTPEARRVLESLLPDRLQFSAFAREGARGYEFVGTGTYGGLLAGYTNPTSRRDPNGMRTRVPMPPHAFASESRSCGVVSQRLSGGDGNPEAVSCSKNKKRQRSELRPARQPAGGGARGHSRVLGLPAQGRHTTPE